MVSYEGFYEGGMSAFTPEYGSVGYKMSASGIGFPGSPQSANQVQDVANAVKHGTKTFEVTMLQSDVGESIPKQHFQEMRALMKLTGVKPSVHLPMIEASGFGEQGWSEESRNDNERRMFNAIEQARALDPTGNLPMVMHASVTPLGTEWRPGDPTLEDEKGKVILQRGAIVNQKTGQVQAVKRERKWRTGSFDGEGAPEKQLFNVETSIGAANRGEWENKLTEVAQMNKHAEELMGGAIMGLAEYENAVDTGGGIMKIGADGRLSGEALPEIDRGTKKGEAYEQMKKADLFLSNAELSFEGAFEQAYEYGSDTQKKELSEFAKKYNRNMGIAGEMVLAPHEKAKVLTQGIMELKELTKGYKVENGRKIRDKEHDIPQIYKSAEEFAMDKAAETFGNLAIKSYDEFNGKVPVLAIENMDAARGYAFTRAEDMRELVKKSRGNFVKQLEERGVDKKKAEKLAEDKIGVTWDVGHLNIMRSKGFTEKDVVEQTKIISKDKSMVKHLHLTDNFGYADTHLAPGMGNVPTKEILEELEKTGRLGEMRKIVEAGGMVQHFRKAPHSMTLAAFGSPIYGMKNGPTWNQALDAQGAYFAGYGTLNPQTHHSYFGSGFTTMPVELGGQMPGGQGSRFGGTPMA